MKNQVVIEDVFTWMDGGTVTLKLKKDKEFFDVEFVQKMVLSRKKTPRPGSLLLNEKEVEIRSELEQKLLSELKTAKFGTTIIEREKELLKKIISDSINFVESEDYIKIAKKVGRIK